MPPALYLDTATYRIFAGESAGETDDRLDAICAMASRLYDKIHGIAPGMLAPLAGSTTFRFPAIGGSVLYLRDSRGLQYFLRSVTADKVEIDTNYDGTYEYTFDFNDSWVRGLPENAVTFGEAFTSIELTNRTTATLTTWPSVRDGVQITSTGWGYPAVPPAVQLRVFDIAHAMSQRGYTGSMHDAELTSGAEVWVMHMIDQAYDFRIPAFA